MSKKLRKQIRELCGLEELDKPDRNRLARKILNSPKLKQRLCNKMPGLSFRDIEKTLQDLLGEFPPPTEEEELRHIAPQKFNPCAIPESKIPSFRDDKNEPRYKPLTPEETRKLVVASGLDKKTKAKDSPTTHKTQLEKEIAEMIARNTKKSKKRG